jgi:hypothetical protein
LQFDESDVVGIGCLVVALVDENLELWQHVVGDLLRECGIHDGRNSFNGTVKMEEN